MSTIDTIHALISRAIHKDTGTEEARTAAHMAVKLIDKHKIQLSFQTEVHVTEEESQWQPQDDGHYNYYDDDEIPNFTPDHFDTIKPVELFKLDVAKHTMTCVKCGNDIRKGVPYVREVQVKNPLAAHFECRSYFGTPKEG